MGEAKQERVGDVAAERAVGSSLRGDGTGARIVAYVPPELAKALRLLCAHDRRSVSDAVKEAIGLLFDGRYVRERKLLAEARDHFIADSRELLRRLDEVENEESVRQQAEADRDEVTRDAREAREGGERTMIDESKLRKHQKEALDRARDIVHGKVTAKVTVASVTPGGGKTKLAAVFSNELLDRKYIEQVVVLVPRNSLRRQMTDEAPKALRSALEDTSYVEYALSDAISEWQGYRQKMYGSRAIVICHKQAHAKMAATFLREKFGLRSTLAISEEPDAPDALRKFRERSGDAGDVLITVLMASEGFDAPDCTHLICLTNIRSRPWLDQALARVTRMNTKCGLPWKQQFAFIYAPNDPEMVSYLDAALDDQVLLATTDPGEVGVSAGDRFKSTFVPIEGLPGGHSYGDTERRYHDHESRLVDRVKEAAPTFASHPAHDLLQLAKLIWPHEFSPEAAE